MFFINRLSYQPGAFVMVLGLVCTLVITCPAHAECSARCKKIKRAKVIGIVEGKQYLQRSRDMLVVKNRRSAQQLGYSAFTGCESGEATVRASGKCAPVVLSTRDVVYLCPNQVKVLPSVAKAERKGFSAYTACDSLSPLPSATPTPETTPIPSTRTFTAESGVRLSNLDSASIISLSAGGYRAYIAQSGASFDGETLYFSDSADGLTFGGLTAITGVAPSSSSETLSRPTILQLADNSFSLIYEKVRHISSAAVDIHNLMRATSVDGGAFSNSPADIVIPNGSAISSFFNADVVRTSNGSMRMYYSTMFGMNSTVSVDNGATWTEEGEVTIGGTSDSYAPYPSEPSVVREDNGTFIMFFTSSVTTDVTRQSIFTAESSDGLTFTVHDEPLLISPEGASYYGPTAHKQNDGSIRLYYVEHTGPYDNVTREMKSVISAPP